jgi:alpha-L-rhamnosidase
MADRDTRPTNLGCEYVETPLGLDRPQPRFNWQVPANVRGQRQAAYQILVASTEEKIGADNGDMWDTGRVNSDQTIQVAYAGKPLGSRNRYYWKVRIWDKDDQVSVYSSPIWFEMGLLDPVDWSAQWIELDYQTDPQNEQPCPLLRKEFELTQPIRRARAYVSALGLYEFHMNGMRVGDHILAPEWTDYRQRVQYQTYDVTGYLQAGANAIGVILGYGWYAGRIGMTSEETGHRHIYGERPRLLLQLEVELADRSRYMVTSDASWRGTLHGPIIDSCLMDGEKYDARREIPEWDIPDFDDAIWQAARTCSPGDIKLVSQYNEPIRIRHEVKPAAMTEPKPGVYVFDMGQNMVGWCRLRIQGAEGTTLTIRHAEVLQEDGYIYTENLGTAAQTDTYILRGDGEEVFEPHFTYHGFRYVEVTGASKPLDMDDLTGCVFYSSAPATGIFECSDPMLNQLMQNIVWTQRGNMHSTPTDCPQRAERLGWMGDAQLFSQTACFNMDMARFFTKWVMDIRDAQTEEGAFADFSPHPFPCWKEREWGIGAPGWADAGVIVPWRVYENYGDKRLLKEHYEAAKAWVEYVRRHNKYLVWRNKRHNDYGDWLNADTVILENWPESGGHVPKEVYATAFFAHSANLLSRMAAVIGDEEDATQYAELFESIRFAFNRDFVNADGRILGDTQAGYALALHFDLLPPNLREKAVEYMIEGIEKYNGHASTGIQSTNRMMLELAKRGRSDVAYRLLMQRSAPSWGYMVDQGATTIWERWDGYVEGRGVYSPRMNSFNHYAFGAVGEWMYRYIAGINLDVERSAYKHIVIRPIPGGSLTHARGEYNSIRGKIVSSWSISEDTFQLEVVVPGNTTGTVYLLTSDPTSVRESGNPVESAESVEVLSSGDNQLVLGVGAGHYRFVAAL